MEKSNDQVFGGNSIWILFHAPIEHRTV